MPCFNVPGSNFERSWDATAPKVSSTVIRRVEVFVVLVTTFPGKLFGMFQCRRMSTVRVNVESVAGSKRARRARAIDCQIKAQTASSVETKPREVVRDDLARSFRALTELGLKIK